MCAAAHCPCKRASPTRTKRLRRCGNPTHYVRKVMICVVCFLCCARTQTWLKVCTDNRTIREAIQTQGSSLTPARLEAAFLAACSISGVYCSDTSAGVHDRCVLSTWDTLPFCEPAMLCAAACTRVHGPAVAVTL